MKIVGNTILITGGTSGIGLALAQRLHTCGNVVIVCGRNEGKLGEAKRHHPWLNVYRCDVSQEVDRLRLFQDVTRDFPKLNVLFNNAGVQIYPRLDVAQPWSSIRVEIESNLEAPIHLAMLFSDHLSRQADAVILNTTSGLSHVPLVKAPIYSATKAALQSYTQSLRHQLKARSIEVIEVSPPMVNTDLGIPNTHTAGLNLDEYADSVMAALRRGDLEITTGFSTTSAQASGSERAELFLRLNGI